MCWDFRSYCDLCIWLNPYFDIKRRISGKASDKSTAEERKESNSNGDSNSYSNKVSCLELKERTPGTIVHVLRCHPP